MAADDDAEPATGMTRRSISWMDNLSTPSRKSTRESRESGDGLSPSVRDRSETTQLLDTLKRMIHRRPSFAEKLGVRVISDDEAASTDPPEPAPPPEAPPPPPLPPPTPPQALWRKVIMRSFYVLISLVVGSLVRRVSQIVTIEEARAENERAANEMKTATSHLDKVTMAVLALLIAANIVIAVRGLAVWRMLSNLKIEAWVKRIQPHLGTVDGTARTINVITLPVRRVVGLATAPFRRRAGAAARAAARAARAAKRNAARDAELSAIQDVEQRRQMAALTWAGVNALRHNVLQTLRRLPEHLATAAGRAAATSAAVYVGQVAMAAFANGGWLLFWPASFLLAVRHSVQTAADVATAGVTTVAEIGANVTYGVIGGA
jgi:hypothetical protein